MGDGFRHGSAGVAVQDKLRVELLVTYPPLAQVKVVPRELSHGFAGKDGKKGNNRFGGTGINAPKIIDGLFSFRKGWLIYTPMMAFALVGIFMLKGALKKTQLPIILFFIINLYITFSWWCWWYGGSFGQRSLVESYALLAIPFTSFIKYVSEKKWYTNLIFYSITLFFIWLNLFQTLQFENMVLHYDGMTKELYFKQFGKLDKIKDFDTYVVSPDYEKALKGNR